MAETLTLKDLRMAVAGTAAAFRCRRRLQPAGGPGDKVFPPTYAGAVYAVEERRIKNDDGSESVVPCVLLDSVQSQANRMEAALQEAVDLREITIPVVQVQFPDKRLLQPIGRVTSLEAPHRIADAILRDSLLDGTRFPDSSEGRRLAKVGLRDATTLYEFCPTALIFGMWDSTGPRGGLGAKFQRALVSEVVGINASFGTKTSSRIDPLGIRLQAGPVYRSKSGPIDWTLDETNAAKDGGKPAKIKDGKPSQVNHGNVTPSLSDVARDTGLPLGGGVTIKYAEQSIVLSLSALRRLHFPAEGAKPDLDRDVAARTTLATLALCAATLAMDSGLDLRSRCLLWPDGIAEWHLLDHPGTEPRHFALDRASAITLLKEAVEASVRAGCFWREDPLTLIPSEPLVELVRKSQELAIREAGDEALPG
jgi:CRISPR-associated protein Csb1